MVDAVDYKLGLLDAMNSRLKRNEGRERVVLSVIPNGIMNDFAAFWGLTEKDINLAVHRLQILAYRWSQRRRNC